MTKSPTTGLTDKQLAGCIGCFAGFFIFGIIGLGVDLFCFTPAQAIGLGLILTIPGAIITSFILYKTA